MRESATRQGLRGVMEAHLGAVDTGLGSRVSCPRSRGGPMAAQATASAHSATERRRNDMR